MTIIQHNFNGVSIHQVSKDSELAGHYVPRGYVNLTEMCKVSGSKKKLADYLRLSSTKEYLEALKVDMGNPVTGLIVIVQGSYAGDSIELGVQHNNFMQLIYNYQIEAEKEFGIYLFQTEKLSGRGSPQILALNQTWRYTMI